MAYASSETRRISDLPDVHSYVTENFPAQYHSALCLLPTRLLSFGPLYDLLEGFKMDLEFLTQNQGSAFPIESEHDLEIYASHVAGTVAELCLELAFYHSYYVDSTSFKKKEDIILAGSRMGIALQYVNIARDIATDAKIGRVYFPTDWLKQVDLTQQDIIDNPESAPVEKLRERLLEKAFSEYGGAIDAIKRLPSDVRAPMRVAVESYMEIGRVLKEKGYKIKKGRATVPRLRRLKTAWKALSEG
jgi:15-cis-phytoene synthase/lycopene beta-cyclase